MGLSHYFVIPNFSNQTFETVIHQSSMSQLTLEDGIFALIFLVVGLFSVFLGYKFYQAIFLVAGAYFGYILTYPILLQAGVTDPVVLFSVALSIGLLAGILMVLVWRIGLFVVGAVAGYLFATFMIGFCHTTVLAASPACYIFTGVCCFLGGILAMFFSKVVLVVTTSCLGSYFFFYGLDVLLIGATGFAVTFDGALSQRQVPREFSRSTWGMLGGCLALAALGMVCQFLFVGPPVSCCRSAGSPHHSRKDSKENRKLRAKVHDLEARVSPSTP